MVYHRRPAGPRTGPAWASRSRGVVLLSLKQKIDMSPAAGELIFHVFGATAHFGRRLIAERTKDGIAAARAKGKQRGRQPSDQDKVIAALKLVATGLPAAAAACHLGLDASPCIGRSVALG